MALPQKLTAPVASPNTKPITLPPSPTSPRPSDDEIRVYANHLYELRGGAHGHDHDDWLEAEACLAANIPKESLRTRMHHHTQITERAALTLVHHGRS